MGCNLPPPHPEGGLKDPSERSRWHPQAEQRLESRPGRGDPVFRTQRASEGKEYPKKTTNENFRSGRPKNNRIDEGVRKMEESRSVWCSRICPHSTFASTFPAKNLSGKPGVRIGDDVVKAAADPVSNTSAHWVADA